MDTLTDFFWEDLLSHIEEGQVVPIVGQDLLTVETPEGRITYYQLLARQLAEQLATDVKNPLAPLPPDFTLSQVVCAYPPFREKRQAVYPRIKSIADKTPVPTPDPLRALARISGLHLFVSTTFDSLLAQALNEERFGGRADTSVIKYAPDDVNDLPKDYTSERGSLVFQLMGQVSASPKYAVTECDQLEFIHKVQSAELRPQRLLDELNRKHLLLLGNSFSDGLTRFFLRLTQRDPLWKARDTMEVLADTQVHDERLSVFLNHFSRETTVIRNATAVDFVHALSERWHERHPTPGSSASVTATPRSDVSAIPNNAVFLSYASEDIAIAHRIQASLDAYGVEVWLDKRELPPGEDYDRRIRRTIRLCALFLPLISQNTERREIAYFRKEWYWALDRLPEFTGTDRRFILPVVVDGTPPYQASVPDEFKRVQWTVAPGGALPVEFLEVIRDLVRSMR